MTFLGKLAGGIFGWLLGGPFGAALGVWLGHQFDKGMRQHVPPGADELHRIQESFFTTLFAVMGHVAKVDGRVSESEIAMARNIMQQMALGEDQKRAAIDLFNKGKQADFPLDATLKQFRQICHGQRNLIQMFLEMLLYSAYADGAFHPQEERLLKHIAKHLGVSPYRLAMLEAMVKAQQAFHQGPGGHRQAAKPRADLLQEAYTVLGIKPEASDAEVKKAYRRQMNQHHPDKLVARGMPEEMMKIANEKTQEIKAAYDTIQKAREK